VTVKNTPAAWGWLAGLLTLLAGLLIANSGCAYSSVLDGRAPMQRFEQAVQIQISCVEGTKAYRSFGTGVIVNSRTLFTAAHVGALRPGAVCVWVAVMSHGRRYMVTPYVSIPKVDLASMRSVEPFAPTYPVTFGRPAFAKHVCAATAFPMWMHRCGDVQTTEPPPGDLAHTIIVEPGNSGSGVYNDDGELIGVITHLTTCVNGQICGGRAATLYGHVPTLLGVKP
jgi:S1-C subfamily serine protease